MARIPGWRVSRSSFDPNSEGGARVPGVGRAAAYVEDSDWSTPSQDELAVLAQFIVLHNAACVLYALGLWTYFCISALQHFGSASSAGDLKAGGSPPCPSNTSCQGEEPQSGLDQNNPDGDEEEEATSSTSLQCGQQLESARATVTIPAPAQASACSSASYSTARTHPSASSAFCGVASVISGANDFQDEVPSTTGDAESCSDSSLDPASSSASSPASHHRTRAPASSSNRAHAPGLGSGPGRQSSSAPNPGQRGCNSASATRTHTDGDASSSSEWSGSRTTFGSSRQGQSFSSSSEQEWASACENWDRMPSTAQEAWMLRVLGSAITCKVKEVALANGVKGRQLLQNFRSTSSLAPSMRQMRELIGARPAFLAVKSRSFEIISSKILVAVQCMDVTPREALHRPAYNALSKAGLDRMRERLPRLRELGVGVRLHKGVQGVEGTKTYCLSTVCKWTEADYEARMQEMRS